jgi:hypothetical protein
MKTGLALKTRKKRSTKKDRELVLTISLYLLNQEMLRKLFWNVKSADYDKIKQQVKIGINTTKGKLGTTLGKLRKVSKLLSDHLYDQGVTFRKAKIIFFVDREDEQMERIYQLLDHVDEQ